MSNNLPPFFQRTTDEAGRDCFTITLPDALKDADAATLAGRYFFLIEKKEDVMEPRVGRHPDYQRNANQERDPVKREDIETWLRQVPFELAAIMHALNDRERYPDGAGALVPDFPPGSESDYVDEARRVFEQAREDARLHFWVAERSFEK